MENKTQSKAKQNKTQNEALKETKNKQSKTQRETGKQNEIQNKT